MVRNLVARWRAVVPSMAGLQGGDWLGRTLEFDRERVDDETALAADRRHLAEWRSTPEGESDYLATVERVKAVADRLRAIGGRFLA